MAQPAIFGCAGPQLSESERRFFREAEPWGFILFARNIDTPESVRALVRELREAVGREAPVLIDQEGGRVARLRPPQWRGWAPAAALAEAEPLSEAERIEALRLRYRLIGAELAELGIDVNCAPLLDLPQPGAHDIIGDRAMGHDVARIISRARAVHDGLLDAGVLPVIKHLPGHGRALVDSHEALPVVETALPELTESDFATFAAFGDSPLAMTAHVVFTAIDAHKCATMSPAVIQHCRAEIGVESLIMTDDLSMKALGGDFADRTEDALAAGCDLILHCNGEMAEMEAIAGALSPFTDAAKRRADRALAMRGNPASDALPQIAARYAELAAKGGVRDA